MEKTIEQLKAENGILRTALHFYGDPKNWIQLISVSNGKGGFEQVFSDKAAVYHDGGVHARKTLEMLPQDVVVAPVEAHPAAPAEVVVDEETAKLAASIIARSPQTVADYRAGKEAAFNRLIGECMRKAFGRGNPPVIRQALKEALESKSKPE